MLYNEDAKIEIEDTQSMKHPVSTPTSHDAGTTKSDQKRRRVFTGVVLCGSA